MLMLLRCKSRYQIISNTAIIKIFYNNRDKAQHHLQGGHRSHGHHGHGEHHHGHGGHHHGHGGQMNDKQAMKEAMKFAKNKGRFMIIFFESTSMVVFVNIVFIKNKNMNMNLKFFKNYYLTSIFSRFKPN